MTEVYVRYLALMLALTVIGAVAFGLLVLMTFLSDDPKNIPWYLIAPYLVALLTLASCVCRTVHESVRIYFISMELN